VLRVLGVELPTAPVDVPRVRERGYVATQLTTREARMADQQRNAASERARDRDLSARGLGVGSADVARTTVRGVAGMIRPGSLQAPLAPARNDVRVTQNVGGVTVNAAGSNPEAIASSVVAALEEQTEQQTVALRRAMIPTVARR
jgi:hypothetical protein